MSIPLVQNNEKDSINTSIIAIKRNIERINMLLGLVDSGSPDLSGLATKQELEDAVNSLQPVDEVTLDNMQSITSNAVAEMFSTDLNDSGLVDISASVTKKLGITVVRAIRRNNIVQLYMQGSYTGSPNTTTQNILQGLPEKYRPFATNAQGAVVAYSSTSPYVFPSRLVVNQGGSVDIGETAMPNGSGMTFCLTYIVG